MCLAIPGQIVEVVDEPNRLAQVDVAGVQRNVNIGLLDDGGRRRPRRLGADPRGFAMSKVDEEEALATRRQLVAHGRGLRAGARRAEGERDRVTCSRRAEVACVLHHLRRRGGARCGCWSWTTTRARALRGRAGPRAETVEIALVAPVAAGRRGARARGAIAMREVRMKYVDEFRDPELGRALAGEILQPGRARPPLQADGGVRRAHPLDLQVRDRRPAARERGAGARPRLPGVRDPDGPGGRRHRDRPPAGRDLHLLRRHDADPRLGRLAARRQGRGRRHPDGLLAARRAADRQGEPRPRGRVLRDRVRDHRAVDGAHAQAREGRGRRRTSSACATT